MFALIASVSFTSCTAEQTLDLAVAQANKDCPMEMGDGMVAKSISLVGNEVVYDISLDEAELTVDDISAAVDNVKSFMLQALQESYKSDSDVKKFVDLTAEANKNIKFSFNESDTGKSVDVVLTAKEFKGE